jgi:hypothetical protein
LGGIRREANLETQECSSCKAKKQLPLKRCKHFELGYVSFASLPSSHRRRRDIERPDGKDARPTDEQTWTMRQTRFFALLGSRLAEGSNWGRGRRERSLSGILDVRVTSLPAESFLKLWKQNSRECFFMVLLWAGYQGRRQVALNRLRSIFRMADNFLAWRFVRVDSKYSGSRRHTSPKALDFYLDWAWC